jgi:hypothetical protein
MTEDARRLGRAFRETQRVVQRMMLGLAERSTQPTVLQMRTIFATAEMRAEMAQL